MKMIVVPARGNPNRQATSDQRMQVVVNVQAEVLDPELARRKANVWLIENAGNLLGAENPELILGSRLLWRCDVVLGVPSLDQPGKGDSYRVGQILMDAATGEIQGADTLAEELQNHAETAAR